MGGRGKISSHNPPILNFKVNISIRFNISVKFRVRIKVKDGAGIGIVLRVTVLFFLSIQGQKAGKKIIQVF